MAHYTMVKNNFFNGVNLPAIAKLKPDGSVETLRTFGYEDFKSKL
nr:carboxynorspermidine decarboxylase [Oscillospiraceae bacterium]